MFFSLLAAAPAVPANPAAPGGGGTPPPSLFQTIGPMVPLIVIFILLFVLMGNSRRKEEKKRKALIAAIKKGDRVQTIGGALGSVVDVRDDKVQIKVDETSNAKMWFIKSAIASVEKEASPHA